MQNTHLNNNNNNSSTTTTSVDADHTSEQQQQQLNHNNISLAFTICLSIILIWSSYHRTIVPLHVQGEAGKEEKRTRWEQLSPAPSFPDIAFLSSPLLSCPLLSSSPPMYVCMVREERKAISGKKRKGHDRSLLKPQQWLVTTLHQFGTYYCLSITVPNGQIHA